jgi:hypothetical protein
MSNEPSHFLDYFCVGLSAPLASVLAINYGTDFITASLMKPAVPFDVLLDIDLKRRISDLYISESPIRSSF